MVNISLKPPPPSVPARPHMPAEAVAWLEQQLKSTQCMLEYGAGGSTMLAGEMGVPTVVSVESDLDFASEVRKAARAHKKTRTFVLNADIGPTVKWGNPATTEKCRKWPVYPLAVWDFLERKELSPDFVLIDGRFRVACFLATLLQAKAGTPIMFDDYATEGNNYDVVEKVVAPDCMIDRCAIFTVPEELEARQVGRMLGYFVVRAR